MIAGEIIVFRNGQDDTETQEPTLIELTDCGKEIEMAFNAGKRRIYVRFRLSDLVREVKEARGDKNAR